MISRSESLPMTMDTSGVLMFSYDFFSSLAAMSVR